VRRSGRLALHQDAFVFPCDGLEPVALTHVQVSPSGIAHAPDWSASAGALFLTDWRGCGDVEQHQIWGRTCREGFSNRRGGGFRGADVPIFDFSILHRDH
jgi:hypothetical protein